MLFRSVDPVSGGWLTVWPCEETKPETSNINYKAGQTIANLTVSKLGDRGVLCLSSTSATHLLADIAGWYPLGSTDVPVSASRVLDTRTGVGVAVGVWPIEQPLSFSVAGAGTPGDARSGVLNITAVNPDRGGYATVWPCGEPRPVASNLNFEAGDTIANLVLTKLGPGATVCVAATANVHLVADLFGWSR